MCGWVRSLALGLTLALAPASGVVAQTLSDTLVTAYENSNLLSSNRAVLRAADEGVAQAVAGLRPVIAAVSQTTDTDATRLNSTLSLTVDLLLFNFGRTRLGIEAAKENVLATRAGLVEAEQQVLLDAATAFMDMRRESRSVTLAQNSLRLNERELRAARDRFEVGEITRTDVSQAEARLAQARSSLALAQGNLEIARARYNLAVGAFPGSLQPPPPPPAIPATLDAAQALGRQNHPSIRRAQHTVKANDLNVAGAVAAMKPSVNIGGDLSRSERRSVTSGGRNSASAALSITAPIYQGGQLRSLHRQALANTEAARADLLQTALVVDDAVARAWAQLEVARASIVAGRQQIRAAELAFEGVREEAKLGARTTLDVLDAEQELLSARNDLVGFQRDEYVSVYSLLSAMGLLTVEHLGLNVAGYDPTVYYNAVRNAPARSVRGDRLDRVLKRSRGN